VIVRNHQIRQEPVRVGKGLRFYSRNERGARMGVDSPMLVGASALQHGNEIDVKGLRT